MIEIVQFFWFSSIFMPFLMSVPQSFKFAAHKSIFSIQNPFYDGFRLCECKALPSRACTRVRAQRARETGRVKKGEKIKMK
jgi:hypothetical protein